MYAKLLQQIIKVEPSAEKNRFEDIANMSRYKWPAVAVDVNRNRSIEIVEVLNSDDEEDEFDNNIGSIKEVNFLFHIINCQKIITFNN